MRKKMIALFLCISTVAALSGCGSSKSSTSTGNVDSAEKLVKLGDYKNIEVEVDKSYEISDNSVQETIENYFLTAPIYTENKEKDTSMIRFANQRFIDIELLLDDAKGLKIPNSAITTKKFFTVPKEYFVKGKGSNKEGLIVTGKDKNTTYITPEIFYEKDGMYYIDDENVTSGTVIQKSDSNETYTIRQTAKLKGVYNINKGYAVFKQIDILYQNEEYAILKQGTDYGVALYDHIALKGNTVKENDLIH